MLAIHMLAGAALAQSSPAAGPGLIAAFFSHFLLDRMPHHEYRIDDLKTPATVRALRDATKAVADLVIGCAAILLLWGPTPSWLVLLGAFLAILPDGLAIVARFLAYGPLQRFRLVHDSIHFLHEKHLGWRVVLGEAGIITAALVLWYSTGLRG